MVSAPPGDRGLLIAGAPPSNGASANGRDSAVLFGGTVTSGLVPEGQRWADLERLRSSHPMMDAVIEEVKGRRIRVGDRWLCDFASCNYLGFDLHPEIISSVEEELRRWGTHPSWSRLLGSPRPYVEIEDQLTDLLGAPDTLLLPTITIIHTSVIPLLAGTGAVLVDTQAHKTIYEGAAIARGNGASLHSVRSNDPDHLEQVFQSLPANLPRMVCIDGVNSMTGNAPDLPMYARLCREYDALLYIDDAHGFGVIGEHPQTPSPTADAATAWSGTSTSPTRT